MSNERRSRVSRLLTGVTFTFALILALSLRISANPAQDPSRLSPDAAINRELRGGEVHTYQMALSEGEFVRVAIVSALNNLILAFQNGDGKPLIESNFVINFSEQKWLSLVAAHNGNYRLSVRLSDNDGAIRAYQLRVVEWRRAEARDASAIAAEKLLAEGQTFYWQGTAESRRKALQAYEATVPLWQAAGDTRGEAEALSRFAHIAQQVGDNRKALERSEQALLLWRAAGDRNGEAGALNISGLARWALSDYQNALADFSQALSIRRETGDRRGEASTLQNIGTIHKTLGEHEESLKQYNHALALWRELGDRPGEASTLTNMGTVYIAMAEYQKALDCYEQSLPLHTATKNRSGQGYTLNNLGDVYFAVGEYQKALDYYGQALPLHTATGDRWGEANTVNHMGNVYEALGEHQKALSHYDRALTLHREINERRGEANSLSDMATVYQKLGDYQKAADYHNQSLALRQTIGDRLGEVSSLSNLGQVFAALGNTEKALDYYNRAFTLSFSMQSPYLEAQALYGSAGVERDRGNLNAALKRIERALDIVESLRARLVAQELRAAFLASVRDLYDLKIDLLIRLNERQPEAGHAATALVVSERARARSLLETLAEARTDIRQAVAPELLERERSLAQQINAKAATLARSGSGPQTEAGEKELNALLTAYQQVQAQIRATSPHYAALTQPQPLNVKEIQQQVLDPETLLLEYSLGETQSVLWAVSTTSIKSFRLPRRAVIEDAARRVYKLLNTNPEMVDNQNAALRPASFAKADNFLQAAADLSRLLLAPVASQLGNKRLVIIGEGALQYLPFGALPVPPTSISAATAEGVRYVPLLTEHEIVSAPSASVLAILRREMTNRPAAPKSVAVFADPVFRDDDLRINAKRIKSARQSTASTKASMTPSAVERSANDVGLNGFVRLRFSRQEAEAIAGFAPPQKRLTALDFVASHLTARSADLSQYRVIHFATHGLLNSRQPELSGVVLSLVDEQGKPQDGFLRLNEIYNLKLNADLVVLSACQTALGKEVRGEGLIGLTRGFMYAGAARVMASLWRVDDRATAELMRRFYQGMLKDELRPAAALRAAQVSMFKDQRWASPYYWAAFTLQGDWR
jgi:CHAT domain-containing protein/Tfp pilus assembly protein PilF